ncbi:hypothetical protein [Pseudokineococcus sp. 1T1Z-3]|uniref:hypothetical protein n=1 Tax=Pseudokineococcus sp. 1T1Z-3 TaxID=3132745 RepID=UPI0030AEEAEC
METSIRVVIAGTPMIGGSALVLYDDLRDRQAYKAAEFMDIVEAGTGDLEKMLRAIDQDPAVESLFISAFDSAPRSGMKGKRRLLARVVAEAVVDTAKIDESMLITYALRDLDAVHIRVLRRLADEWHLELQTRAHVASDGASSGTSEV